MSLRWILNLLLLSLYSLVVEIIALVAKGLASWRPSLANQVLERLPMGELTTRIKTAMISSRHQRYVVIFCSSAGELEQALPLLDRLQHHGYQSLVFMFSHSGLVYARSRTITHPIFPAPWDSLGPWFRIFNYVRPEFTLIIRHEIWPCFLFAAKHYGKVCLVNGSLSRHSRRISLRLKSFLFKRFDQIYVVSQDHKDLFKQNLELQDVQLKVTGDTKYDRVIERTSEKSDKSGVFSDAIRNLFEEGTLLFVLGSAWDQDLEVVSDTYVCLPESIRRKWRLVIVPHDLSSSRIDRMTTSLQAKGLDVLKYKSRQKVQSQNLDAIIVEELGMLAEIYSLANAAFVGGGMHHRVHNVLEPSVYAVPLAFGPHYQSVHEADLLVEKGLAKIVYGPKDMKIWWQELEKDKTTGPAIKNAILELRGASDRIVQELSYLGSNDSRRFRKNSYNKS